MSRLRAASTGGSEEGVTLIELLVATTMSVVLLGAIGSMVIGAMRAQPETSERAQNISSARWVLERMTREIRSGVAVDTATPQTVSFRTYLRRTACGATGTPASAAPAIECKVTYSCSTNSCTRTETAPTAEGGTPVTVFTGINSSEVFTYEPDLEDASYVEITLRIPNPTRAGSLTISDGASLRNATLGY